MKKYFNKINNYLVSGFLYVFYPLDKLFLNLICKKNKQKCSHPPIFIIGVPRSGSTVLYQILTNYFDFIYISNLASLFYHSLFIGIFIQKRIFKNKPHNNYLSDGGYTKGLNSPHECGKFWYRWFPKDPQYVSDVHDLPIDKINNLKKNICCISSFFNKSIIFKNTVNSLRLRAIKYIFPNALIIWIKREPLETALSILKYRIKRNNDKEKWWALKPKNYDEIKSKNYCKQIAGQIYYTEKQISIDLNGFSKNRVLVLQYEKLCNNQEQILDKINNFFIENKLNISKRKNAVLPNLTISKNSGNIKLLNDINCIKKEIKDLYGNTIL